MPWSMPDIKDFDLTALWTVNIITTILIWFFVQLPFNRDAFDRCIFIRYSKYVKEY